MEFFFLAGMCFCVCVCVESYTDLTPLHSCTFASVSSDLSDSFDHSPNAVALAQGMPENRVAFDMVAEHS